jgi:tetratricopeptide (TPR) repeat protein
MRFKPKTVRRLLLLAAVAVVVLGGAFSLFVVRHWQTNRRQETHRGEGLAAFAEGRHRKAVEELAKYVQLTKVTEPEVWLALADAGQSLEQPDFGHLRNAARALQQYLVLRPDDQARRLEFVRLSNQTGSYVDALDAVQRLRPSSLDQCNGSHIDALREEAIALTASRIYNDRLDAAADRLLTLAPLDLQGWLIRLEHWGRTHRKQEARQAAQALAAAHPDSPVAQLVFAASYLVEPTPDDVRIARAKLAQSVGLDGLTAGIVSPVSFADPDFTSRAVDLLDRLQAFDHALAVLKLWNQQRTGSPKDRIETGLLRTLARRLWQAGDHDALEGLVSDRTESSVDSEVLAFRAMALAQSSSQARQELARRCVQVLEGRPDDYRAAAWLKVLPMALPGRKANAKEDADTLRAVIKSTNRSEPVFMALLGESYAALARMEEARDAWKGAGDVPICASWPYPHVRRAETFLVEGRTAEAVQSATQALMIAPNNPSINALWFDAQAMRVQSLPPNAPGVDVESLAQTIERVNQQVEAAGREAGARQTWERLLPARVLLLSRTAGAVRATSLARQALSSGEPLAERTLQRLASVSVSEGLGIERECLQRVEGLASPAVALTGAVELAKTGKIDDGLAMMDRVAAGGKPEALLARAQFLEYVSHPLASTAWKELGDRFPDDVGIQRACLTSASATADAVFIDRTISRYQKLSGLDAAATDDAIVRTARARVLLAGGNGDSAGLTLKDRDAAVAMLAQVASANPKVVEPKVLLARALLLSDAKRGIRPDEPRAAGLLAEALALEPRSASIAVELASLYMRMREPIRAREVLSRIAADPAADPAGRHAAAAMLLSQGGESAATGLRALEDIDRFAQERGVPTPLPVLIDLAEALARQRRDERASEVFSRVAASPMAGANELFFCARFHQRRKNLDALASILETAASRSPGAGALVRARLAEDRGDLAQAWALFEDAVTAEPANAEAWTLYASSLMSRARGEEALKVAHRASSALPGQSSIKMLVERAKIAATSADGEAEFGPLIAVLAADPSSSGALEVIKALEQARQQGDLDQPARILDLADRFSDSASLQMYLAQRVAPIDAAQSVLLANRALTLAPSDVRTLKAAAELFLGLERWTELVSVANAWKQLEGGLSPEPDIAIAQARLNTRDFRGGLTVLRPWADEARANPSAPLSLPVLNMQTRLLIASGQEAQAREFLQPLLAVSSDVRTSVWIRAAAEAVPTLSSAKSWLALARQHLPHDAEGEHLALAAALSTLASRFPDQATVLLEEAKSLLTALTSRTEPAGAAAWEALGIVCHRLGATDEARSAYERAVSIDPRRSISLNNMASLLLEQGTGLDAALSLAQRAVEASGDASAWTTLGSVQHALANRDQRAGKNAAALFTAAVESFHRAAKQRPGDPASWIRLAEAASAAGDHGAAAAAWERVAGMPGLEPIAIAAAKNNVVAIKLRSEMTREDLIKARMLIEEAIRVAEEPAFLDTLGWLELLSGRRDRAVDSFRRSIAGVKAEAKSPSPVIGLATALAGGSEQDRREAASLLSSVKKDDLPPHLQERLQRVRSMVQVDKP